MREKLIPVGACFNSFAFVVAIDARFIEFVENSNPRVIQGAGLDALGHGRERGLSIETGFPILNTSKSTQAGGRGTWGWGEGVAADGGGRGGWGEGRAGVGRRQERGRRGGAWGGTLSPKLAT